jgi:hypothetical protein
MDTNRLHFCIDSQHERITRAKRGARKEMPRVETRKWGKRVAGAADDTRKAAALPKLRAAFGQAGGNKTGRSRMALRMELEALALRRVNPR